MNIFRLLALSIRVYALRFLKYQYITIAYALSVVVGMGIAVTFLILNGAIALLSGPSGTWISNPLSAFAILLSSLAAVFSFFYIHFGAAGAYVHTCAKIGAGERDVGVSKYIEYMVRNAHSFFAISFLPNIITIGIIFALLFGGVLISQISLAAAWVVFASSALVWFFVQTPFLFAYAAKVVEQKRSFDAIKSSVRVVLANPMDSLVLVAIIYFLAVAPAISVFFYPIYFFVFLSPFVSILTVGFYEVERGLLRQ